MEYVSKLLELPAFTLFAIMALGLALGSLSFKGISLGHAGVLFVALPFGHFHRIVPQELTDLGLLLFVYSVGLQAGPRFVGIFRARAKAFLLVGLASTGLGALAAVGLGHAYHIDGSLTAGIYCGATTCTPALAAVMDTLRVHEPLQVGSASVGYGVAYPFSVFFVVLLVQALPLLLRTPAAKAAAAAREEEALRHAPIGTRCFKLTNPNCAGKTVADLAALDLSAAKLSRVKHDGRVAPALPDTHLELGDVVRAVGTAVELDKLHAVLGDEVDDPMIDPAGAVVSVAVVVSQEKAAGASIQDIDVAEEYGVIVTRVRREGIEFAPGSQFELERGDVLRVVGSPDAVQAFTKVVGAEERRLAETSLLPVAFGMIVGAAIGLLPIPLPGGLHTQLGLAGGTFIAALVLGHMGRIGPIQVYVPNAAKFLARDLGLLIFLAGAGTKAGEKFLPILHQVGPQILVIGAVVTVVSSVTALLLLRLVLRWNMLSAAGAISACMTNPPALSAANKLADSDASAIGFASIYPVAIISKILLAQLVYLVARL